MGLVEELDNAKTVVFDANILIYFIEKHPKYFSEIERFLKYNNAENYKINIVTSVVTLIEVLIKPFIDNSLIIANQYKSILIDSRNLSLIDLNVFIAEKAAKLRAKYNFLKTPDAIQLATAIDVNADYFITNDMKLKSVTELKILILDEVILEIP